MTRSFAALGVLFFLAAPAFAGSAFESVDVGLEGSLGRETDTRSLDWGPTLSLGVLSSDKAARYRFKYELEYAYDDYSSKFNAGGSSEQSRVRTHEFKYAKVSFLELFGWDIPERLRFTPYVSGGVQYVDSRSTSDGVRQTDFFWAPTWGAGIEFALNQRTTLGLDYDANTLGGSRRVSHLNLALKIAVFGNPEEPEKPAPDAPSPASGD